MEPRLQMAAFDNNTPKICGKYIGPYCSVLYN